MLQKQGFYSLTLNIMWFYEIILIKTIAGIRDLSICDMHPICKI